MIEHELLNYLSEKLSVPCYMEMPEDIDGEFIVIEKVGKSVNEHIYMSAFAVQSYADSLEGAAVLSNKAVNAMLAMPESDLNISNVTLNSEANFTDVSTRKYRYQATIELIHYEE